MATALEETAPSCHCVPQIPQPFAVWTEGAHCVYLCFLEDAFVNGLHDRHYCFLDNCGCSPPFTDHTPPFGAVAERPSSAAPASSSLPQQSQSSAGSKASGRRSCTGPKARSAKRKGKWLSNEVGHSSQLVSKSSIGPVENMSFLEQPGNSSQPSEISEYVVPKAPQGCAKRSRIKPVDLKSHGFSRQGTDQVVPMVCEEG